MNESIFLDNADQSLEAIDKKARELSIKGVAVVAFIPGEVTASWVSKMKVVGTLADERANYLAIAGTKAAEMAVKLQNSGMSNDPPLKGETGYKGGQIEKVKSGYILVSFSGGPSELDLVAGKAGMEILVRAMK